MSKFLRRSSLCLSLVLLVLMPVLAWAQTAITVSGTVTDETGDPLTGVMVVSVAQQAGGQTDSNGRYLVTLTGPTDLTFSYIGHQPQTVNVNTSRNDLDITLQSDGTTTIVTNKVTPPKIQFKITDSSTGEFIDKLTIEPNKFMYVRDGSNKLDQSALIIKDKDNGQYIILNAQKQFLVIDHPNYRRKTIDLREEATAANNYIITDDLEPRVDTAADPYEKKRFLELGEEGFDPIVTNNIVYDAGKGFNPDEFNGSNEQSIQRTFFIEILPKVNRIIGVVAILYLMIVGLKYIFANGNGENAKKYSTQIIWIVVGLFIVSVAEFAGFAIYNPTLDIVDGDIIPPLYQKAKQIIRFIEYIAGGVFLLNGILAGFGILSTSGDDEKAKNERNFIVNFIVGSMFILIAEVFVRIVSFYDGVDQSINIAIGEMGGIVNFILTFMAGACGLMLILASAYYVANFGNEEQASKAKRIIFGCVLGLVVSFSSYVIAQFLII